MEWAAISASQEGFRYPVVRKAGLTGPFDLRLTIEVAGPLTKPGEVGYVTKECSCAGTNVHFVVWVSGRWPLRKLWSRCTGFLVLDKDGSPITDIRRYDEFFKAFATWEEAYLRPVVVQSLSKETLELKARILRVLAESSREVKFKKPTKELDRQILSMHEALTISEVTLTPLLEEEQLVLTRTHNLLLRISEDGVIHREALLNELSSLSRVEDSLTSLIDKRAEQYEYWLALLEAKGMKFRFSWSGAFLTVVSSSVSAVVIGNPTPLSLISLPFLRYVLDAVSGVRSLRREARNRSRMAVKIRDYLLTLGPEFNYTLARFPSSSC